MLHHVRPKGVAILDPGSRGGAPQLWRPQEDRGAHAGFPQDQSGNRLELRGDTLDDLTGPSADQEIGRTHKTDPLVARGELIYANQNYAFVTFPDGREDSISMRVLALVEEEEEQEEEPEENQTDPIDVLSSPLQAPITPAPSRTVEAEHHPPGIPDTPSISTTPGRTTVCPPRRNHAPSLRGPRWCGNQWYAWNCEQYQDFFKGGKCDDMLRYITRPTGGLETWHPA
ncbi:uncharacterized protein [Narcine bancroftii]|uniref:uncharacterized protein n=1 Tax=Narcine bancroftii TaxID=1343680 RepID=UPI0038318904